MPHSTASICRFNFSGHRGLIASVLALALTAGCSTTAPRPAEAVTQEAAAETEIPVDEVFDEAIHWTRNSAEYHAIFVQTYTAAGKRIRELAQGREPGTWAVSLDADETLVDNSLYQVEIARRGESYGPDSWNPWVHRKEATALPGTVEFTALVNSLGGIVAVVTNRRDHLCASTAENIAAVGITFDVVLCRVDDGEKEPRFDAVSNGTTAEWPQAQFSGSNELPPAEVIMWLGDNIGDFPDQTQALRNSHEPLEGYGDRFFVLPNPMYGSWEANPKE